MITREEYETFKQNGTGMVKENQESIRQYEAVEKVRKEILSILKQNYKTDNTDALDLGCETEHEFNNRVTNTILSLIGGIPDPDQTRPENPIGLDCGKESQKYNLGARIYLQAQSDMIAAGWRKMIMGEGK
jgi:hypothetical protein